MWVQLSRKTVVRIYCYCREGERSVDAALWTPWPELTNYYGAQRIAAIRQTIEELERSLGDRQGCSCRRRDELTQRAPTPGLLRVLFGKWFGQTKTAWPLLPQEIQFFASSLLRLLQFLSIPEKPSQEELINLRMDLHACQYLVECRCYGLPELAKAQRIEHFYQSPAVAAVKLADLAGSY